MAKTRSKNRVRVAFCIDSFAIGGTELNAVRTAEALDLSRVELTVLYLQTNGPLRSRYERLGVYMRHFPIPNLYSLETASQGWSLAGLLRHRDIDVVHCHDIYSNIFVIPWARLASRSAVIGSRRWLYEAPRPELVSLNRWCSAMAHRIIANSSAVVDLLEKEERVRPSKIVELPNFIDPEYFVLEGSRARAAKRGAWGIPSNAFLIGIVARLSPVKNHELLLEAMALLDGRFHLAVIGEGPARPRLQRLAEELNLGERVHFLGELVSDTNLHQYFDVSALCSRSEGSPNSLLEAMAAGNPVVATPVGGNLDVVDDGETGLLVPVDDPAATASAIRSIAADSNFGEQLGRLARAAVRARFNRADVINRLSTLYETLAESRRSGLGLAKVA